MPPPNRGGMGGAGWMGMRSYRQDRSVLHHHVKKGTTRRMLRFAVPYRRILHLLPGRRGPRFRGGRREPAHPPGHHRQGDPGPQRRPGRRVRRPRGRAGRRRRRTLAVRAAGSRPSSAKGSSSTCAPRCSATSSGCRWRSSRGPRPEPWSAGSTTTSSAHSRPSPICLSNVVGNLVTVVIVLVAMFILVLADHAGRAHPAPCSSSSRRARRTALGAMTRESYDLNAR